MPLQSSGQISLNDIHIELGETSGTQVSFNDADVRELISASSEAEMEMADFYGVSAGPTEVPSAGQINSLNQNSQITASTYISSGGELKIPANFYLWSDSTSTPALTIDIPCTIINEGYIMGKGGHGAKTAQYSSDRSPATAGGDAIKINSGVSGVTITNNSTGIILGGGGGGAAGADNYAGAGGGGGGSGGGNGGRGRTNSQNPSGGTIGQGGTDATGSWGGNGGSGGGSGAGSQNSNSSSDGVAGGGGGRIPESSNGYTASGGNPGTAQTWYSRGGNGYFSSTGQNAYGISSGAGGGGWGQSGGSNTYHTRNNLQTGAGEGKAVEDNGVSYTLTNNGTIYGGT